MLKLPRVRKPPLGKLPRLLPFTVRGRIILGFGLLVLILAVVVAGSAWLVREYRANVHRLEMTYR